MFQEGREGRWLWLAGIDKGLENYSTNVRFYPESPCQPDYVSKQWDDMKRFPFSKIIASRAVEERGWKQEEWWVMSGTRERGQGSGDGGGKDQFKLKDISEAEEIKLGCGSEREGDIRNDSKVSSFSKCLGKNTHNQN